MQKIHWSIFPFFAAIFAASSALLLQYFMNFRPCELCYTQRYIWYVTAIVSAIAYFWRKRIFIYPILLLILASVIMGLYQSGMVFEWWTGVTQCGAGQFDANQLGSLSNLGNLDPNNLQFNVSCSSIDQKLFNILPLPLANALFAGFTFVITLLIFRRSQR
ncbi:MAG: disulfide bond formation protein B [Alphaproteobacteria bacterium]